MDMDNLEFKSSSFDKIVISNALAYSKNVEKCLRGAERVLAPSGELVFQHTYAPVIEDSRWHIMGVGQVWPGNKVSAEKILSILETLGFRILANFQESYENADKQAVTKHHITAKKATSV